MSKPLLHQHLAAETHVRDGFNKIKQETMHVFKGGDLFVGLSKAYKPVNDAERDLADQTKEVVTTVSKRLDWTKKKAIEYIDHEATKEKTNTLAKADVVVDGKTIAKDVPATVLLSLEKRLVEIRDYYDKAPTLDLSKPWQDTGNQKIMKYGPAITYRTKKKIVPVRMAAPTDKHPEQVKESSEDVVIGHFEEVLFSGAAHPGEKAKWLERIDRLIVAVKEARCTANTQEVQELKMGEAIFSYIHEGDA